MQEYRIQTTLSKGWLEKQSGGKAPSLSGKKSLGDKMRKWDIRFFVLTFDAFYYFKYEEDFLAGRPAKGRVVEVVALQVGGAAGVKVRYKLGIVARGG